LLGLITLVKKDLRLLLRDRTALLLLLAAPIIVISTAGFSLSTLYGSASHLFPIANEDGGVVASELIQALMETPELDVKLVERESGRRMVADSPGAGALLVIPAGFSEAVQAGQPAELLLAIDPVKHLEVLTIRAAVERARAAIIATRVAARIAVVQVLTYAGEVDFEALGEDSVELARRLLDRTVNLSESSVFDGPTEYNTFDQNVPGFSVTFLMLGMLFGIGLGLLDERQWGMVYRLAASPLPPWSLVVGKVGSRFVVGVSQMALLFAFGRAAFGISLGPSLLALALVIAGITFASAALGLLASGLAPSRDAVLPMGTIAVVAMAAIGGCWWPITIEPVWLQRLAHLFPTAWAMEAFNDLMLRRRELVDVLPACLILVGFGCLYLVVGARLYRGQESSS
jgi:ABC-2 type transport system permease protein